MINVARVVQKNLMMLSQCLAICMCLLLSMNSSAQKIVEHWGTPVDEWSEQEQQLVAEVRAILADTIRSTLHEELHVFVKGDVIEISGYVFTQSEVSLVSQRVRRIDGVRLLRNKLSDPRAP